MRAEKQFLADETGRHLAKSDYVFLTSFTTVTVEEVAELRSRLAREQAEFHVVKNNILRVAARRREYPDFDQWLKGQTAIVVGGRDPAKVAQILRDYRKEKNKVEVRCGVLDAKLLSPGDVESLADLPPLPVLRAKLLGLLRTPAQQFVVLLNAAPASFLRVLQAKAGAAGGGGPEAAAA